MCSNFLKRSINSSNFITLSIKYSSSNNYKKKILKRKNKNNNKQ